MTAASFNPRSHMGSDLNFPIFPHFYSRFQSTLPHGERLEDASLLHLRLSFNPRSHMGSDALIADNCKNGEMFQSTLPHGERQFGGTDDAGFNAVSIHAPTWGATRDGCSEVLTSTVSIHAPTWGATLVARAWCPDWYVSIHAPTWGATSWGQSWTTAPSGFNPRSHMGSDCRTYI